MRKFRVFLVAVGLCCSPAALAAPKEPPNKPKKAATQRPAPATTAQVPEATASAKPKKVEDLRKGSDELSELRSELNELRLSAKTNASEMALLRKAVELHQDQTKLGLSIVKILLAVVGLFIPIFTYFTSILPASRVISEAKKMLEGLDERFLDLTRDYHNKQVQNAIEGLASDDASVRTGAANYLEANSHHNFTDGQLRAVCRAVETADQTIKVKLLEVLGGRNLQEVTDLMVGLMSNVDAARFVPHVVKQLTVPSGSPLHERIRGWLGSSPSAEKQLSFLLVTAAQVSREALSKLLNDDVLVHTVDLQTRAEALASAKAFAPLFDVVALVESSVLAKSLAGRVVSFVRKDSRGFHSAPPEEAQYVAVYNDGVQEGFWSQSHSEFKKLVQECQSQNPKE